MDILAAEQDLETKLESDISNIAVEAYPDDPDNYNCMGPTGAILIRYNGSVFTDMESEAMRGKVVSQERTVEWIITILYRNLKAHTNLSAGIYTYLEAVRNSLTGYTIDSIAEAGVMYPVNDKLNGRDPVKKLWEHEIVFRHTIPETKDWQ